MAIWGLVLSRGFTGNTPLILSRRLTLVTTLGFQKRRLRFSEVTRCEKTGLCPALSPRPVEHSLGHTATRVLLSGGEPTLAQHPGRATAPGGCDLRQLCGPGPLRQPA